jgi:KaiC/GvpD/RAD55 family RecA-like ATPase
MAAKSQPLTFGEAVRLAREIPDRPLAYLAEPWIPRGELTFLVGDPAIGKSTFAAHIAANIAENGDLTLFLSTEDYAEIIKGRLRANSRRPETAPALDRVAIIDDLDLQANYPRGLTELRAMVKEVETKLGKPRLVVLDPVLNFLEAGTAYKKSRLEIQSLRQWCRAEDVSILGVIHRTKDKKSTRGSGALVEVARNIIGIRPVVERGSDETRCLYHEKCSYNRPTAPQKFRLNEGRIQWPNEWK